MDGVVPGSIGAGIIVAMGIAYRIYLAINHRRIRSKCCGTELSASIDVEPTTPRPDEQV